MSRIYRVQQAKGKVTEEVLVRADTVAGAIRHIAQKTMSAEVATQDDLIRLGGQVGLDTAALKSCADAGTHPLPRRALLRPGRLLARLLLLRQEAELELHVLLRAVRRLVEEAAELAAHAREARTDPREARARRPGRSGCAG